MSTRPNVNETKRERDKDARRHLADRLARCRDPMERVSMVKEDMRQAAVVIDERPHFYRLSFLGRVATCTSDARGTVSNWVLATLKEFGHA